MAIRPPSDIVLDVARAVDPARMQAAMAKLSRASAVNPADGDVFADLLGEASSAKDGGPTPEPFADLNDLRTRLAMMDGGASRLSPGAKAGRDLEAFVLKGFVESTMPKTDRLFGRGQAGQAWRSMMAEQIGKKIAEAGGIGIARLVMPRAPEAGGGGAPAIHPSLAPGPSAAPAMPGAASAAPAEGA